MVSATPSAAAAAIANVPAQPRRADAAVLELDRRRRGVAHGRLARPRGQGDAVGARAERVGPREHQPDGQRLGARVLERHSNEPTGSALRS